MKEKWTLKEGGVRRSLLKTTALSFPSGKCLSFGQMTFTILILRIRESEYFIEYSDSLPSVYFIYFQVTNLSTNSRSLNFTWKHNKSYNKISFVFLHVHSLWTAVKCSIDNNASMCGLSVCVLLFVVHFSTRLATVAQPTAGIWTGVREIRSDRGLKRDRQRWEDGGKKTQGKEKSRMFRGRWQTGEGGRRKAGQV